MHNRTFDLSSRVKGHKASKTYIFCLITNNWLHSTSMSKLQLRVHTRPVKLFNLRRKNSNNNSSNAVKSILN